MLNDESDARMMRGPDVPFYSSGDQKRDAFGIRELIAYRGLIGTLAKRDLLGSYSNSALGVIWRFITPITSLAGYSLIFGIFGQIKFGSSAPYPLVMFCGLLPWLLFSTTLVGASSSILTNSALIKKIYFPRLIPVVASMADKFIDVGVGLTILLILLVATGSHIGFGLLLCLFYCLWAMIFALAVSLWTAWISVLFRDIGHALPMVLQVFFYLAPIVYPAQVVPEKYRWLFELSPIVSIINGMRWAALDAPLPSIQWTVYSVAVTAALFVGGLLFFRRAERVVVDTL